LDTHIHTCLYFIDISSINGLSEADRYILKKLSTRVNIVPVIGKSDTLTSPQVNQLKAVFRKEVFDILQIPVYGFIEVDDDEEDQHAKNGSRSSRRNKILEMLHDCVEEDKDEDAMAMIDYLHNMPFTIINYEEDAQTGRPIILYNNNKSNSITHSESTPNLHIAMDEDEEMSGSPTPMTEQKKLIKERQLANKTILGRSYPWAVVECCNPAHCDFAILKKVVLSGHRDMLRIDTFERFYEQYRTDQLLNRKVSRIMRLESKEGVALV
jgi:cell division control protein 11